MAKPCKEWDTAHPHVPCCNPAFDSRGVCLHHLGQPSVVTDSPPKTADRHDSGKPELAYVDTFSVALDGVALVSTFGATKYSPFNYMKGAKNSLESYNCARRHMKSWLNGEDLVPDAVEKGFNVHHIDAAIWNLMRLRQELVTFPERDNRPCKVLGK